MIRLSEFKQQMDPSFSSEERRPRRSYRPSPDGIRSLISHTYERGITGSTAKLKRKKQPEIVHEVHASRFPAIIAGSNVSYDQHSKLFTVSGLHDGKGETFYFKDLPYKIRAEIQKMKPPHTSDQT